MSKFLVFEKADSGLLVRNKNSGDLLGKIYFYGFWKKYVFEPRPNSAFSADCLKDIVWRMNFLKKS